MLAKPGVSTAETLSFQADVGQTVRNGTVESVDIDNVALTHDDPPYTLYRITLDDDARPVRTVLIENVRAMPFHYYDGAGNTVAAVGGSLAILQQLEQTPFNFADDLDDHDPEGEQGESTDGKSV